MMNQKTFLNDVHLCKVKIVQREEQRAELERQKKHLRPETYKRISRNINNAIKADSRHIKEIEDIINAHPHELQRTILYEKYVQGISLLKIAERLNYSAAYICAEHTKAMKIINKKDPEADGAGFHISIA